MSKSRIKSAGPITNSGAPYFAPASSARCAGLTTLPALAVQVLTVLAASSLLFATGCKPPLPPSKPLAQLTPQEAAGHTVFQNNCARCHYPNTEEGFHGPGLQGLYKKPYLPSGAPANDDRITAAILHGRNMMPAFGNKLDEQQLADLLAYLHTL